MTRSRPISIRLSEDERDALDRLCGPDAGQSDVIRLLIRDRTGLSLPVAPVEACSLKDLAGEFRRIGINLNQAVRAMNEGRVAYEPELATALGMLIDAVFELRADMDGWLRLGRSRKARAHVV